MNYNLRDAEELRIKMTRLAESVDSVRQVPINIKFFVKLKDILLFTVEE